MIEVRNTDENVKIRISYDVLMDETSRSAYDLKYERQQPPRQWEESKYSRQDRSADVGKEREARQKEREKLFTEKEEKERRIREADAEIQAERRRAFETYLEKKGQEIHARSRTAAEKARREGTRGRMQGIVGRVPVTMTSTGGADAQIETGIGGTRPWVSVSKLSGSRTEWRVNRKFTLPKDGE